MNDRKAIVYKDKPNLIIHENGRIVRIVGVAEMCCQSRQDDPFGQTIDEGQRPKLKVKVNAAQNGADCDVRHEMTTQQHA